jgi:hypothetical protein
MKPPTIGTEGWDCIACAGCTGCLICGAGSVVLSFAGLSGIWAWG